MILTASDAPLLALKIQELDMTPYKPGESVRTDVTSMLAGLLTDPSSPAVTVSFPDASVLHPTPVKDTTGNWHATFTVPPTMRAGIGAYRWQSSGSTDEQNGLDEVRFQVEPLDF